MDAGAAAPKPGDDDKPVAITAANEATLDLGDGICLWFRTVRSAASASFQPTRRRACQPPEADILTFNIAASNVSCISCSYSVGFRPNAV